MEEEPAPSPESQDDRDEIATLEAARSGDHAAGARLVRRYGASMLRTAWNVTGRYGGADAEDIVQEALIAALTTPAAPTGDVGAWLRSITARKALDWVRRAGRRAERAITEPGERAAEPASPGDPETPVSVLAVRQALARLKPLDRAVLTLVDLEGFSMTEAAAALGSTRVAVKWRAVRARRRLRDLLESGV